jgi:hypothetical protein
MFDQIFERSDWVRARAMAVFMLVYMGTWTAGSAFWGYIAGRHGTAEPACSIRRHPGWLLFHSLLSNHDCRPSVWVSNRTSGL